jgi:hypothetical protein
VNASHTQPPHVLVIANETVTSPRLADAVRAAVENRLDARVLVVAPALNSRLRHWASDDRAAVEAARVRVRACIRQLARDGLAADGMVGDPDPVLAIEDALRLFPADTLVIATRPWRRSNWLAHGLLDRARGVFAGVIVHVVVEGAVEELRLPRRPADDAAPAQAAQLLVAHRPVRLA